jgi:hypothetical protein
MADENKKDFNTMLNEIKALVVIPIKMLSKN